MDMVKTALSPFFDDRYARSRLSSMNRTSFLTVRTTKSFVTRNSPDSIVSTNEWSVRQFFSQIITFFILLFLSLKLFWWWLKACFNPNPLILLTIVGSLQKRSSCIDSTFGMVPNFTSNGFGISPSIGKTSPNQPSLNSNKAKFASLLDHKRFLSNFRQNSDPLKASRKLEQSRKSPISFYNNDRFFAYRSAPDTTVI